MVLLSTVLPSATSRPYLFFKTKSLVRDWLPLTIRLQPFVKVSIARHGNGQCAPDNKQTDPDKQQKVIPRVSVLFGLRRQDPHEFKAEIAEGH
jgi:hypothetical protein